MPGQALLFFAAAVGNAAVWVWVINVLYGTRFRGWPVTLTRWTCQVLTLALPAALLVWRGDRLLDASAGLSLAPWPDLPVPVLAWVAACWGLALVVLPGVSVARWLRRPPACRVANHTRLVRLDRELGRRPLGQSRHPLLARLPWNEICDVEFVDLTLRLDRLPARLDGLSIWHISDTHLCGCPDRSFYEYVLDRCAGDPADLVVVTGDVLDSEEHYHWIVPLLGRLRGRYGSWAVLGNHDAWLDVPRIVRRLERAGFTRIGGQVREVDIGGERIQVIGNEWPWLGPPPDLDGVAAEHFRLCLSHSPDTFPWARRHGVDLVLAGHNHGGQVRLPLLGPVLVPSRYSRRYDAGVFFRAPTAMVVSRGLGQTYPLRYRCRPEVTRLRLLAQTAMRRR
jgi:predicted MPP superfamily phosphohydrolase